MSLFNVRISKTLKSQYFLKFHVFKDINLKFFKSYISFKVLYRVERTLDDFKVRDI